MAFCCAALGSNDSYVLNSPNERYYANIPPRLASLLAGPDKAKQVYNLALGPCGTFCIAYEDATGPKLRHVGLPAALEKWLLPDPGKGVAHDLTTLRVTLGPDNSYFAIAGNGAASWGNLPPTLREAIEKRLQPPDGRWMRGRRPLTVALGPDGMYVMTTECGGGKWDLKGMNPRLDKYLRDQTGSKGVTIILSPCRGDIHLVISDTGLCRSLLPESHEAAFEAFRADWRASVQQQNRAQQQQAPVQQQTRAQQQQQTPVHQQKHAQQQQTPVQQKTRAQQQQQTPVHQQKHAQQQQTRVQQQNHTQQRQAPVQQQSRARQHNRAQQQRASAIAGKVVGFGLKVLLNATLNATLNAASGGGGGGTSFVSGTTYVDNSSINWSPINSAASDPIQ